MQKTLMGFSGCWKMEKMPRRLVLRAIPFFLLLISLALYTIDLRSDVDPSDQWKKNGTDWRGGGTEDQDAIGKEQGTNSQGSGIEDREIVETKQITNWGESQIEDRRMAQGRSHVDDQEHNNSLFERLLTGENQTQLEATGFACHSDIHTEVFVSTRQVRIDMRTMKIYAPFSQATTNQSIHTTRPYPRREDQTAMDYVSPVQIIQGDVDPAPSCRYNHDVPAVVFSSGGFTGNIFHEFNEVIIPLFLTTRHFQSRLRFVVTDFRPQFVAKFSKVLSHLSSYEVMNPEVNKSVHCFPGAVVGLHYHDNVAVKPTDFVPEGYSMLDFTQFIRDSYHLKTRDLSNKENPTLVLISRSKTRMFLNEDRMVALMRTLGFNVVIAKPDTMVDVDEFAEIMNSCDVLVGAHGAGLTNEIFMPPGAVMVQVVGLNLEWASTAYYGGPATEMGLHYIEYKVEPEETSLLSIYGKDDPIITDPASVEAKGYRFGRAVYLEQQNFIVNLGRFRKALVQALELLGRTAPSG